MANEFDYAIAKVLLHYYEHFDPPENRKEWNLACCPDHIEERPSFSVNYEVGAFKCHACDFRGDVISLIKRKEGLKYAEAVQYAETILGRSYDQVSGSTSGKRRRRVFGESGANRGSDSGGQPVSSGIRGRTTPWA